MNATAALKDHTIEMRAFSARRTAAERLVLTLTVLGLIASLVEFVIFQEARSQFTQEIVPPTIAKPPLYYATHATQIVLLVSAGLLAFFSTDWRTIQPGYLLRFVLFIGAAFVMAARGYSLSDLLSTKLVDATGPFPCLISVLVFVGARRSNWGILSKAMMVLAAMFSVMTLIGLANLSTFSRAEGVANVGSPLNGLYWPASWIALSEYPRGSYARRLRFAPMVIYAFGSFFTQTRLNFVMIFAFLVAHAYLARRRKAPQSGTWIAALTLAVWVCLFTAIFLTNTRAFQKFEDVAAAFNSRIDQDTRTDQIVSFASIPPQDLLVGKGSFATWQWGDEDYAGGTDVGYLTLLLYGGVPLLVTYIAAHLTPALTVLRKKASSWQLTSSAVVLLWGVRMFSSSYAGLSCEYYPVLFLVGACISRESFQQRHEVSGAIHIHNA